MFKVFFLLTILPSVIHINGGFLEHPDLVIQQLSLWKNENFGPEYATNELGNPYPSLTASITVGENGPIVFADSTLVDRMAHFDRGRTPERVIHAKGVGSFGYFQVTNDISNLTKACIFDKVDKRTPIAVRFSTTMGEYGSADTVFDPRGFAIKFYTECGVWDLVGANMPVFFIRDPILFPRFGVNTFKLINLNGHISYVKFHLKTNQGIQNINRKNATYIAGESVDYAVKDLTNAILNKDYPSWDLHIQIMSAAESLVYKYNPFDPTKIWSQKEFPLRKVGRIVLDRNPVNFYTEVEQLAFSPSNLIPGIEPSMDKLLQARMFSYKDAQRYRLGKNFEQLPPNHNFGQVRKEKLRHYFRDGASNQNTYHNGAPTYFPNSFSHTEIDPESKETTYSSCGPAERKDIGGEDNYSQVDIFWTKVLCPEEKKRICENIAFHAKGVIPAIQTRIIAMFKKVNDEFGTCVHDAFEHELKNPSVC